MDPIQEKLDEGVKSCVLSFAQGPEQQLSEKERQRESKGNAHKNEGVSPGELTSTSRCESSSFDPTHTHYLNMCWILTAAFSSGGARSRDFFAVFGVRLLGSDVLEQHPLFSRIHQWETS